MAETEFNPVLYKILHVLLTAWFKVYHRMSVRGAENVPLEGGCVIASNHASYLDPPMFCCAVTNRHVSFMARDTLFKNKWMKWFMFSVGVIPMSRDRGDIGALKLSIAQLKSGKCIGLFPEGTRTSDGQVQNSKGGIGFLVAKAGVPVVPAYIHGSFESYPRGATYIKPHKVSICFGKPLTSVDFEKLGDGKDRYELASQLIMTRIKELRDPCAEKAHVMKF